MGGRVAISKDLFSDWHPIACFYFDVTKLVHCSVLAFFLYQMEQRRCHNYLLHA